MAQTSMDPPAAPAHEDDAASVHEQGSAKRVRREDRREAKRAAAAEGWTKCMFLVKAKGRVRPRARLPPRAPPYRYCVCACYPPCSTAASRG